MKQGLTRIGVHFDVGSRNWNWYAGTNVTQLSDIRKNNNWRRADADDHHFTDGTGVKAAKKK